MRQKGFRSLKGPLLCSVVMMVAIFSFVASAYATNGYFAHGYSIKNKALAGAGVALPMDALTATTNPAGMVFLGNRVDAGLTLFMPSREYTVRGNPSGLPGTFGLTPGTVKSDSEMFVIPSVGVNWMLNENRSVGVSIYGNGGMNTDYDTNTFYGSSPTGIDLMQLFVTPTYSVKLTPKHAVGISAILAYQSFEASGLQAFGAFSADPTKLTNNGHDDSYGYGARIGYLGEILPDLYLGASYQTKILMSKLDKYAGLFAEQGDFDIPSNWTVGLGYKVNPAVTLLLDVQRINYSDVNSVSNPFIPNIQTSQLGNDNGAGFGWEDMTVYKFGLQWQSSRDWTWRAGYSIGDQPIPGSEVLFNILAPGVIKQHATLGFTKAFDNNRELSASLMRAFSNSISGPNPMEVPGQQDIELEMNQWELSVGYSWKF
ncbi:putative facilitator of salicylate uptake [hydrothermal vent metagenome]|uniref:Putative facilitator of salicylate uptake n=1 Tax=hydrothermal vent metagenome TaxID=652676 RepID=A0A3B1CAC9_9ZZZZ